MADCCQTGSLQSQHAQFFVCILGRFIINSFTEDFHTTLQTRAGPHVSNNGPLLLWLLLTHFHSSTITYLSQLTESIHSRSLSDNHYHDIKTYIVWLQQQLTTIQSIILVISWISSTLKVFSCKVWAIVILLLKAFHWWVHHMGYFLKGLLHCASDSHNLPNTLHCRTNLCGDALPMKLRYFYLCDSY